MLRIENEKTITGHKKTEQLCVLLIIDRPAKKKKLMTSAHTCSGGRICSIRLYNKKTLCNIDQLKSHFGKFPQLSISVNLIKSLFQQNPASIGTGTGKVFNSATFQDAT